MLGYRTVFHVQQDKQDVLALVREQLHSWLRHKNLDPDALRLDQTTELGGGTEGILLERTGQDGSYAQRVRIVENQPNGAWRSHLTLLVPRPVEPATVWFDVVNPEVQPDEDDQSHTPRQWTATPKFVRDLVGVLPAYDGSARLDSRPRSVVGDSARELADIVADPKRRGPVYVAGSTTSIPQQPWFDLVAKLLRETVGLGAGYVLDPAATELFSELVGPVHAVLPGTMRTFLPGVETADSDDALRHRVLSTQRIVRDPAPRLRKLLGWRARDVAIEGRLPRTLARLDEYFETYLDHLLVDGDEVPVESAPVLGPEHRFAASETIPVESMLTADHRRDLELGRLLSAEIEGATPARVREIIALARFGEREQKQRRIVSQRLEELQGRNSELQRSVEELGTQVDDGVLEQAVIHEELIEATARVRHLQGRLHDAGRWDDVWSRPVTVDQPPNSLSVLLEQISELDHIVFTGDKEKTYELEKNDRVGLWAAKAWDALLALQDYAAASVDGRCARDVHGYLASPPDGCRGYSTNRHARDESEDVQTNTRFRAVRMLPVPSKIDPAGAVFMGAHFKIANSGMISPRMHYHDATALNGKVYVGYLGRHLPTQKTN